LSKATLNILVIDGQGGQLGSQIIKELQKYQDKLNIISVGTNAIATSAMVKAGCKQAATGENSVIVACRKADIIIGPIGIVIADAMYGEVTPAMAAATGSADAVRILIPVNKCENIVAGVSAVPMSALIQDVVAKLEKVMDELL